VIGAAAGFSARPIQTAISDAVAPSNDSSSDPATDSTRRYVSSQATISSFRIQKTAGATLGAGLLFAGVAMDVHRGVAFDDDGEPVWIDTTGADIYNLRVQQYRGEPVLTYTSGLLIDGYGIATGTILDSQYQVVATVRAANGLSADLHEFLLTDRGTAIITAYPTVTADLSSVGGPKRGHYIDGHLQEIDVATGELLLDWRASDHIALSESYQSIGSGGRTAADPWDPFHLNAAAVDIDDNRLLISARHTHALYAIDRSSGVVQWRLNGKKSDFTLTDDAVFAWQHHVTRQSATTITVFDNHVKSSSGTSRGLALAVDESARTVRVAQAYTHADRRAIAMGNTQHLDGGNVLVGWGTGKALTEFAADGTTLLDVRFEGSSYRSFRAPWVGTPASPPAIATRRANGQVTAYVSWNGSTETARWRFEYGDSAAALTASQTVARTGFETSASIPSSASSVRAVAVGADGTDLTSSVTVSA